MSTHVNKIFPDLSQLYFVNYNIQDDTYLTPKSRNT